MDNQSVKYKQLYEKVKILRNKLYDLEEQRTMLRNTVKEAILINDEIIFKDKFDNIKSSNNKIINEITNTVIPNISNKL